MQTTKQQLLDLISQNIKLLQNIARVESDLQRIIEPHLAEESLSKRNEKGQNKRGSHQNKR